MGYHKAGFEVVGVDIEPQKRYPFEFHQEDAVEFILKYGKDFDVIAASPPCQDYTPLKALTGKIYPRLIKATRAAIRETDKPHVIENVPGARFELDNPIMLCGTMFGLKIIRHRYFECDPVLWWPPNQCTCSMLRTHSGHGQYSAFKEGATAITVVGHDFPVEDAKIAMRINWMTGAELSQAIPPAYTEWIGKEIRKLLNI